MDKDIRLSGIAYESLVNGPGIRRVFFSQGCKHNCKGCFNPDTHDFNGGENRNMDELIESVLDNPMIKGVTFSGGDPLEQAEKFAYMAKAFKNNNLNIWCYTGYTYEYIREHKDENNGWNELLNNIDVLVDGKFEEENMQEGLKFRGSTNQRIIDIKESLNHGKIVTLDY
ncbi:MULTISPECIES: anaerobic ribonucleoside-triphosphate reductase activating protein [Clostridium]|jgi:anaerobic ribonucleoside-triphosphate reductase activating protein|uniref:Anaerobic ribonucleoside-triphosphate reductase-activating protein n=3 Tax=root TaxID=1 RepID=A0A0Q1DDG0_CLOBU|nr:MULTISPECIES: anaerobic ribonucleoside-triphosphate reductase activating protein [Clostridium]MDU4621086.1 anaerobic ribonucleoside-triphosphate reductase activating protein [Clostridioides difficile]ALP88968.1 ribonucleoside-triphosphate reductase activating protein [Clostridium butyricum]ALS15433.1 ribonucleoside-triphosphate reductase activating protein [Clostridium butyricum]ANF12582.1 anaerobic ribonucleoside-triphosphate reductase activating protein [Clostridium butyricum]AOR92651.1 a